MSRAAAAIADIGLSEVCIARAAWQMPIFAAEPRRSDLLRLTPTWLCRPVRLHVRRNQPFEFITSVLRPFLAYAGWDADITYSEYDDSVNVGKESSHDVELVWLDFDRYLDRVKPVDLAYWIFHRLTRLRFSTEASILVTDWAGGTVAAREFNQTLKELIGGLPGTHLCTQSAIAEGLGERYYDLRTAQITGTSMSDAACIHTARQLGLSWLPAILGSQIRAVVVDLDGTIFNGVLGEDGIHGIKLTSNHIVLQRRLLSLRERGVYLAVASRNDPGDVKGMFDSRPDFLLRPEHLSACSVSWSSKAAAIRQLADQLRIGPDAMLLIDDNPGELAAAAAEMEGLRCLHAADAATTARAVELFPGIFAFDHTADDALRVNDMAMASRRRQLAAEAEDDGEYLHSLGVQLTFALGGRANLTRLHQLSVKTNQFNTGLHRLSEMEVARYWQDADRCVVAISLRDRLSESGIVGAVFARRDSDMVVVDEIAISCRALGRRLEHLMITEALRGIVAELPAGQIGFRFTPGPRNRPAREWLVAATGCAEPMTEVIVQEFDAQVAAELVASAAVEMRWEASV